MIALLAWSAVIAWPYLNFDPAVVPLGREYLSAIQTHHLWTRVAECGLCGMWNGTSRGGWPAFADPYGSMLHPLVSATSLIWGVLNGSKVALIGAFFMAGLAQWWIARELGLGLPARVWGACLAVAAGHLGGRIENGTFGVLLSTAAASLALPALMRLARRGTRRSAVLLGLTLASAGLAGQVYLQLGLVFLMPLTLLLVPWRRARLVARLRRFALAIGLALLLVAPLLVPFAHFIPQISKDADPAIRSAQPFAYVPLNLVINDRAFYGVEVLGKLPFPYLYINFVGWAAVLLALWTLRPGRSPDEGRAVVFLASVVVLAFWIASAAPLRWFASLPVPLVASQFAGARHPSLIAGLAVPGLLALAAIGLDRLLAGRWFKLRLQLTREDTTGGCFVVDLRWLLIVPLTLSLLDAKAFGSNWIGAGRINPGVERLLAELRTPDLQWINPPVGEQYWIEPAIRMGLKLAYGSQGWDWKDRPPPEPVLEANRAGQPNGTRRTATIEGVPVYTATGREYASVSGDGGLRTACTAHGTGGDIDVKCDAAHPGVLTVKENNWVGWQAHLDGQRVGLKADRWLALDLPAGGHTIELRYRPWDVPLGLLLGLVGVGLAIYWWRKPDEPPPGLRGGNGAVRGPANSAV